MTLTVPQVTYRFLRITVSGVVFVTKDTAAEKIATHLVLRRADDLLDSPTHDATSPNL